MDEYMVFLDDAVDVVWNCDRLTLRIGAAFGPLNINFSIEFPPPRQI